MNTGSKGSIGYWCRPTAELVFLRSGWWVVVSRDVHSTPQPCQSVPGNSRIISWFRSLSYWNVIRTYCSCSLQFELTFGAIYPSIHPADRLTTKPMHLRVRVLRKYTSNSAFSSIYLLLLDWENKKVLISTVRFDCIFLEVFVSCRTNMRRLAKVLYHKGKYMS